MQECISKASTLTEEKCFQELKLLFFFFPSKGSESDGADDAFALWLWQMCHVALKNKNYQVIKWSKWDPPPPPSFPSEELNDSSINTVKSSRAGLMAMLRPIALLQRSVSEKLIQLKQTKRPLAPIKFGWNVKPCDGHTHSLVASQAWFTFA